MGADPTLSHNGAAMNRPLLAAALTACLLTSCTSYRDDVATICDAPDKIGDTSKMRPGEKMALMGKYCEENVKSDKGKELLWSLAASPRGVRNKIIRTEAAKVGINPCHLADVP
jgi:hypothetical protein